MNLEWTRNKVDKVDYVDEVIGRWLVDYRYEVQGDTDSLRVQVVLMARPGTRPAYYVRLPHADHTYTRDTYSPASCVYGPTNKLREAKTFAEMLVHTGLSNELHSRV